MHNATSAANTVPAPVQGTCKSCLHVKNRPHVSEGWRFVCKNPESIYRDGLCADYSTCSKWERNPR